MVEWVNEKRSLPRLPNGRMRFLFMDNCSSHTLTEELKNALKMKNTELRALPANNTDILQLAGHFFNSEDQRGMDSLLGET